MSPDKELRSGRVKQSYLVVYDYGQGGVWGYVRAESAEEVERKFPQLTVVEAMPDWLRAETDYEAKLRAREEDVDNPRDGILGILTKARQGDA